MHTQMPHIVEWFNDDSEWEFNSRWTRQEDAFRAARQLFQSLNLGNDGPARTVRVKSITLQLEAKTRKSL